MKINNHCQHCGGKIPYHGPWKEPESLKETDHGLEIIFTHINGSRFVGTVAVIRWESSSIVINSQLESNMPIADVSAWMPAPE